MDTTTRLITKSTTWQLSGLIMMTIIGYLFTGSFTAGGGIAALSCITGFFSYFIHEMIWMRVRWGRRQT